MSEYKPYGEKKREGEMELWCSGLRQVSEFFDIVGVGLITDTIKIIK